MSTSSAPAASVTTTPGAPSLGTGGSPKRRSRVLITVFIVAAFLLIFGGVSTVGVMSSGAVTGLELSPDTFAIRSFSYYEIPGMHVQISPIVRNGVNSQLSTMLVADKLLPPRTDGGASEWHLVSVQRGAVSVHEGDADLLFKFLQGSIFGGQGVWLDWTKKHPETAKVLWPMIGRLARRKDYVLVPDLFELARNSKSTDEFRSSAAAYLAREYRRWAEAEHAGGDATRALELLDEGLVQAASSPTMTKSLQDLRRQWAGK